MRRFKLWTAALLAASLAAGGTASAAAGNGLSGVRLEHPALYEIRTEAGTGEFAFRDGSQAAFNYPSAVLYDAGSKRLIVADTYNQRLRAVNERLASTVAGVSLQEGERGAAVGGMNDGGPGEAVFNGPSGLAMDAKGVLYVADSGNHSIRTVDAQGNVQTLAGSGRIGLEDGSGKQAKFHHPLAVAAAPDGTVYVADTLNHVIRKIAGGQVTTLNSPSSRVVEVFPGDVEPAGDFADGPLKTAKFNEPSGLALDAKGNLYVSDTGNQRIRYIDFAKGTVTTVAGGAAGGVSYLEGTLYAEGDYADGPAARARFNAPRGLAATPDGGLLIADSLNHAVRYMRDGKVTTIAGKAGESGNANGPALAASFNKPLDVAWIGDGKYAVADAGNSQVRAAVPFQLPDAAAGAGEYRLIYNDQWLQTDAPPLAKAGSMFVPVRAVADKLGYRLKYKAGKVELERGDRHYQLTLNDNKVIKKTGSGTGKQAVSLPAAPFSANNRVYVPVRFFAEELGLDVKWAAEQRAVLIRDTYS